ncbi:hypothetical protein AQV86_00735 [Nanohaloarchaea archaeon SG9]|nr:hypothetical protein AQV86_00735 [Nanohaloarchaea archaeon SG9]
MGKSLSELRDFAVDKKGENETVYAYFFLRRLSPFFTWIFLRLGASANMITFLGLVMAVAGSFMFYSTSLVYWVIGWVMYQLYYVLDCSDGEIAVLTDSTSDFGGFLDKISHPITNSFIIYVSAFGAYRMTGSVPLLTFSASGGIMFTLLSLLGEYGNDEAHSGGYSPRDKNIIRKAIDTGKHLVTSPGGITHPLAGFLALDAITGGSWRIFYPVAASTAATFLVIKRFRSIKEDMK